MSATGSAGFTRTRAGTVLTYMPMVDSTFGIAAGRPAVAIPNTTSDEPVMTDRTCAHVVAYSAFGVTPMDRATAVTRSVKPGSSRTSMFSGKQDRKSVE